MKCPKCGFNSFEYHDVCKKCSTDLVGHKLAHGILPVVLPQEAREAMALSQRVAEPDETGQAAHVPESPADMFTFDLPEDETSAQDIRPSSGHDPFDFDEEPAAPEPRAFADFTFDEGEESVPVVPPVANANPFAFDDEPGTPRLPTSLDDFTFNGDRQSAQAQAEYDAFASLLESAVQDDDADGTSTPPPPAASSGTPGEFDLEDFAWDTSPAATEQPPPSPVPEAAAENPGEFDLDNFSWDESPATGTKPEKDTDNPFDGKGNGTTP